MTDEPTYLGFPIKKASPAELRDAVMHGEFIHSGGGMAFYKFNGVVYVVEAGKPVSVKSTNA